MGYVDILLIISILPVFLIGYYVYKKDSHKESKEMLIKLFFLGILSCYLTLTISDVIELFFPDLFIYDKGHLFQLFFNVLISVGLIEEFSKWIMAYLYSFHNPEFDYFYDMIIYCVVVSLGFACFENILYVFDNGIGTGILRMLLTVPFHACNGVEMGYFLALAKVNQVNNRKKQYHKNFALSLIVPTLLHGIYDFLLMTESYVSFIIFLAFVITLYIYIVKKIKRISTFSKRKIVYKNNYCPYCGKKVNSDYCPYCGRKNN